MDTRLGFLPIITLAALFLIIGLLVAPRYIQDTSKDTKELYVVGKAEQKVLPDVTVVSINITNESRLAKTALEENQKQFDTIKTYFENLKKDYNDIKLETTSFSVNPKYDWDYNLQKSVFKGYEAVHTLNLRIEDFNSKGTLLVDSISEIVKYKSVSIPNLYFELSDALKETTKNELVGKAMKDSWSKAKAIGDSGMFIVDNVPSKITLNYSDYTPYYYYDYAMKGAAEDSISGAANTNITPREVDLSVSVDATYTYK